MKSLQAIIRNISFGTLFSIIEVDDANFLNVVPLRESNTVFIRDNLKSAKSAKFLFVVWLLWLMLNGTLISDNIFNTSMFDMMLMLMLITKYSVKVQELMQYFLAKRRYERQVFGNDVHLWLAENDKNSTAGRYNLLSFDIKH